MNAGPGFRPGTSRKRALRNGAPASAGAYPVEIFSRSPGRCDGPARRCSGILRQEPPSVPRLPVARNRRSGPLPRKTLPRRIRAGRGERPKRLSPGNRSPLDAYPASVPRCACVSDPGMRPSDPGLARTDYERGRTRPDCLGGYGRGPICQSVGAPKVRLNHIKQASGACPSAAGRSVQVPALVRSRTEWHP